MQTKLTQWQPVVRTENFFPGQRASGFVRLLCHGSADHAACEIYSREIVGAHVQLRLDWANKRAWWLDTVHLQDSSAPDQDADSLLTEAYTAMAVADRILLVGLRAGGATL